jgi:hypothetical protein
LLQIYLKLYEFYHCHVFILSFHHSYQPILKLLYTSLFFPCVCSLHILYNFCNLCKIISAVLCTSLSLHCKSIFSLVNMCLISLIYIPDASFSFISTALCVEELRDTLSSFLVTEFYLLLWCNLSICSVNLAPKCLQFLWPSESSSLSSLSSLVSASSLSLPLFIFLCSCQHCSFSQSQVIWVQ